MNKRRLKPEEIDLIFTVDDISVDTGARPTVLGVGINDVDFCVSVDGKHIRQYTLWKSMLNRCYSEKFLVRSPSYGDCSVCDEWLRFSNFLVWCNCNPHYSSRDDSGRVFDLDKDLIEKGNQVYCPLYCDFIPHEINTATLGSAAARGSLPIGVCFDKRSGLYAAGVKVRQRLMNLGRFTNPNDAFFAYKKAKESVCKSLAQKYERVISRPVYESLIAYSVDFLD